MDIKRPRSHLSKTSYMTHAQGLKTQDHIHSRKPMVVEQDVLIFVQYLVSLRTG